MTGPFVPDNTVQASRFGVSPIRKFKLQLQNVNRAQGQKIPELQGNSLYIEKTDYPFLISFVTADTNEQACVVARAGLRIAGPIKEVTVTHPLLTPLGTATLSASIIQGAGGQVENSFAFPFHQGLLPIRVGVNSAVGFNGFIHLPIGARHLSEVTIALTATTLTGAGLTLINTPNLVGVDTSPTLVDQFNNAFATGVTATYTPDLVPTVTGSVKLREVNIPVPYDCIAIQFSLTGTGFSGLMTDKMIKVVCA